MAPRREILDSDEEDNFSPIRSPITMLHQDEPDHLVNDDDVPRDRRAESTDPSFFRTVYEDQKLAAGYQEPPLSRDPGLGNEPDTTSSLRDITHEQHLSSITDPLPASRREKQRAKMDIIDLTSTQVTTPGHQKSSVPTDVWDFPASPNGGGKMVTPDIAQTKSTKKKTIIKLKTYNKRKSAPDLSAQKAEENNADPQPSDSELPSTLGAMHSGTGAEQISPEQSRKRQRVSSSSPLAQSTENVDLVIIPRSDENPVPRNKPGTPKGHSTGSSIVEDSLKTRSSSLLVVPNTLTASQKEEYILLSLSSEGDRNNDAVALPTILNQAGMAQYSSGTTTIPYPTPTHFRIQHSTDSTDVDSSTRLMRSQKGAEMHPPSSPDIISGPVANTPSAGNRALPKLDELNQFGEAAYLPSSPPSRAAKRPRKTRSTVNEAVSPTPAAVDNMPPPRTSTRATRPSRKCRDADIAVSSPLAVHEVDTRTTSAAEVQGTLNHTDLGKEPATQPETETAEQPPTIDEHQPKKRGRKRKAPKREEMVAEGNAAVALLAPKETFGEPQDGEGVAPPAKRKRGRPRKSEMAKAIDTQILPDDGTGTVDGLESTTNEDPTLHAPEVCKEGTSASTTAGKKATVIATSRKDSKMRALSELDSNSSLAEPTTHTAATTLDTSDNAAKENQLAELKVKEKGKGETKAGGLASASQAGKVQYRVGLSKRSRIAPLLKSLRK